MHDIEAINQALFLRINANSQTPHWVISLAIMIANNVILLIPALLLILWLWSDEARRSLAIKACLVALLGVGLNQIVGMVWPHPRPSAIGLGHSWLAHAADSSFPSDHLTVFSSVGLTLLLDGAPLLGVGVLASGLGVAWARVFLGVHFPMDMLGGFGIAFFVYLVVSPLWRRVGQTVTNTAQKLYRLICSQPIRAGWIRP